MEGGEQNTVSEKNILWPNNRDPSYDWEMLH